MELLEALATLDPAHAGHWTADGLPRVDVVSGMVGRALTRAQITEAAPDATRTNAKAAAQAPPKAAQAEPVAGADPKCPRTWLYHPQCPEGRIFQGVEVYTNLKAGWVDSPAALPKGPPNPA
jgi:hypothetical protein